MAEKRIVLSIIVPVYNVEKYLSRCMDSLYTQGINDDCFEVILVNDGSTDNSLTIAEKKRNEHTNIYIYTQENQGMSAARNHGLRHANGDFVIFVDSDDWLLPNTINNVLKIAVENNLDVCGYRFKMMQPNGSLNIGLIQPFNPKQIITGEDFLLHKGIVSSACANMYSREFIQMYGLNFTVGMTHEDVDFNARVYGYAKRMMFTDIVGYVYYYNPTSMNRSKEMSKVRKFYLDDVLVAKNMYSISQSSNISNKLKYFYIRHANSIIASDFLALFRNKKFHNILREYLDLAHKESLYPIEGRTLSWKTTLLLPLINRKHLYRFL